MEEKTSGGGGGGRAGVLTPKSCSPHSTKLHMLPCHHACMAVELNIMWIINPPAERN